MDFKELFSTKRGKDIATLLGISVLLLTGVHYYYTIKINRMKVKELEAELEKAKKG